MTRARPADADDDRGALLGDGLFETVLWSKGRLVLFEAHFARLARGCAAMGLPAPDLGAARRLAEEAVAADGLEHRRAAVRLTWSAGPGGRGLDRPVKPEPRLRAVAAPAPRPDSEAVLITAETRRNHGSPASRMKTLSYIDNVLARREARLAAADEALMLDGLGRVACAAAANLFWFEGDRLVTPAPACGVLAGIVRAQVLAEAAYAGLETAEVAVDRTALDRARGLFLTNSLIGVRPVRLLDGAAVEPHLALPALAEAVRERAG